MQKRHLKGVFFFIFRLSKFNLDILGIPKKKKNDLGWQSEHSPCFIEWDHQNAMQQKFKLHTLSLGWWCSLNSYWGSQHCRKNLELSLKEHLGYTKNHDQSSKLAEKRRCLKGPTLWFVTLFCMYYFWLYYFHIERQQLLKPKAN